MPAKPNFTAAPAPLVEVRPLPAALPPGAVNTEPFENPDAVGQREEIREVAHRVIGSRQSERKVERSRSRRQPKRGHGSQRRPEQ
jgi:hypothetical protein